MWREWKPVWSGPPFRKRDAGCVTWGSVGPASSIGGRPPKQRSRPIVGLSDGNSWPLEGATATFRQGTSSSNKLLEFLAKSGIGRPQLTQSGNRLAILAIGIGPKVDDAVPDECSEVDDVDRQRLLQGDALAVHPSAHAR